MRASYVVKMIVLFAVLLVAAFFLRKSGGPAIAEQCQPYRCVDGTEVPACTDDGHVINYFAPPCMTHGGEIEQ